MAFKNLVNKIFKGKDPEIVDKEKNQNNQIHRVTEKPKNLPEEDLEIKVESLEEPFDNKIKEMDYPRDTQIEAVERPANLIGELDIYVRDTIIQSVPVGRNSNFQIGRDPMRATIVISEAIISKLHCSVIVKGEQVLIKDNGSTNGTYFDNQRVDEQLLSFGNVISLGKKGTVKLVYRKPEQK